MAAAAVMEAREPFSLLFAENSLDLTRPLLPPSAAKLLQRSRPEGIVRKSASMGPTRNIDVLAAEETMRTSPTTSVALAGGHDQAVQTDIHVPAESLVVSVNEEEPENAALLQLKLEAMTWAAMAKDDKIASLEKRLKVALKIAKAEQERNAELESLLRESKAREVALEAELQESKAEVDELADAEERLVMQLGDFEVEAVEEDQRHQSELSALADRLERQESVISSFIEESKLAGRSLGSKSEAEWAELLEARREEQQPQAVSSSVADQDLEASRKEVDTLQVQLREAKTEVLTSQQQKRNLSKRLRRFEKDRRQGLSKSASRSSRTRQQSQRKFDS